MIILSDDACWLPFIILALLHYNEITNAERHYVILSVIILPVNSVLNPIIYHYNRSKVLQKFVAIYNFARDLFRTGDYRISVARRFQTFANYLSSLSNMHPSAASAQGRMPSPCTLEVRYNVRNSAVEIMGTSTDGEGDET